QAHTTVQRASWDHVVIRKESQRDSWGLTSGASRRCKPLVIIILNDSKSVLESLKSVTHKSPSVILELHKILRSTLKHSLRITPIWVPVHRGIAPNESADRLAKSLNENTEKWQIVAAADRLAKSLNENTEKWQIVAAEDLIVAIRKKLMTKKKTAGKHANIFKTLNIWMQQKKKKNELKLKKGKGDVLLSKFRTNMLPTNKLLHRFNIASSPNCEFCVHTKETISRILFHFPRYRDPRVQLLKKFKI
ncbi:hypothetical protein AVEN_178656-1, partial [Araneus ventricosus]